jgi:hypothetical protein
MFVSVKSLTALIDQDIQFYIDGVASKEQHSPEEFEKWHKYIKSRLVEQLSKLKLDKKEAAPVFSGGFFSCILAK